MCEFLSCHYLAVEQVNSHAVNVVIAEAVVIPSPQYILFLDVCGLKLYSISNPTCLSAPQSPLACCIPEPDSQSSYSIVDPPHS